MGDKDATTTAPDADYDDGWHQGFASGYNHGTSRGLGEPLAAEICRQDAKHGSFSATTELGRLRLAIACLEDEVAEVRDAWREERRVDGWPHTREELLQVAAIAMRILREFGGAS